MIETRASLDQLAPNLQSIGWQVCFPNALFVNKYYSSFPLYNSLYSNDVEHRVVFYSKCALRDSDRVLKERQFVLKIESRVGSDRKLTANSYSSRVYLTLYNMLIEYYMYRLVRLWKYRLLESVLISTQLNNDVTDVRSTLSVGSAHMPYNPIIRQSEH